MSFICFLLIIVFFPVWFSPETQLSYILFNSERFYQNLQKSLKNRLRWYNTIQSQMFHHQSLWHLTKYNFKVGLCCEFPNNCPAAETKLYCDSFTLSFMASQWSLLRGRRSSVEERGPSSSITTEMNSLQHIFLVSSLSPVEMSDTHTSLLVPLQSPTNTQCYVGNAPV